MKRNGFDEDQADKRVASQPMTNEERAARATMVLSNEGTEEQLAEKVWNCFVRKCGTDVPDRFLSCVVVVWSAHRGGSAYTSCLHGTE